MRFAGQLALPLPFSFAEFRPFCGNHICTELTHFQRIGSKSVALFQEIHVFVALFLQDEEGVISTFSVLGQGHPTYTECIAQELLQEVSFVFRFSYRFLSH